MILYSYKQSMKETKYIIILKYIKGVKMTNKASTEVLGAVQGFPYFVLRREVTTGYNIYAQELLEIQQHYIDYKKGVKFYPEGTGGDYVPSTIRFKKAKVLIDKEARFMFSQTPDIVLQGNGVMEEEATQIQQYQKVIDTIIKDSAFSKKLLQSAKDCFIGKRVAVCVDYDEHDGALLHFYSSLQFYYETEYGSDKLTKFVTFENVTESKTSSERIFLVNRYEIIDGVVWFESTLFDGGGNVIEELIASKPLEIEKIPAVIIFNDGTLTDKRGISEIVDLIDIEQGYSKIGNADIDSERKGMNPIRYVVDMNSATTKNLSSGAGAFWEMKSEQNQNNVTPMVGTLAPQMNHTESVKTTLERLETNMHELVDVPNITAETLQGTITSGKALEALYYPLQVRCDEKMKTWIPALQHIFEMCVELVLLNKETAVSIYGLTVLDEIPFNVEIIPNYALLKNEADEKDLDITEINAMARSRKSYIKKWRKDEFKNDKQIEDELLQIAIEQNMMDTLSLNSQVQTELNQQAQQTSLENQLENVQTQNKLEFL